MAAVGGANPEAAPGATLQPTLAHGSGHAVMADHFVLLAQDGCHPQTAVGATGVRMDLAHLSAKRLLPRRAPGCTRLPGVIAAARDREGRAQVSHGVFAAHGLDPGIPLGDGSERMPAAFFRISRCSVTRVSSRCKRSTLSCNSSFEVGFKSGSRAESAARLTPAPRFQS